MGREDYALLMPMPGVTWCFALMVVRLEDRFLVVHEAKHGQRWYLPAGRVEPGETFAEAAARETLEEAGVVVRPTALGARPGGGALAVSFRAVQSEAVARDGPQLVRDPRWARGGVAASREPRHPDAPRVDSPLAPGYYVRMGPHAAAIRSGWPARRESLEVRR